MMAEGSPVAFTNDDVFKQLMHDDAVRCSATVRALTTLLSGELAVEGNPDTFATLVLGLAAAAWHSQRSVESVGELATALGLALRDLTQLGHTVAAFNMKKSAADAAKAGAPGADKTAHDDAALEVMAEHAAEHRRCAEHMHTADAARPLMLARAEALEAAAEEIRRGRG